MRASVKTLNAVVYQGAAKRYFTKKAAMKSFFYAAIRRRCECEDGRPFGDGGYNYSPEVCAYHLDPTRTNGILLRRFISIHFGLSL